MITLEHGKETHNNLVNDTVRTITPIFKNDKCIFYTKCIHIIVRMLAYFKQSNARMLKRIYHISYKVIKGYLLQLGVRHAES